MFKVLWLLYPLECLYSLGFRVVTAYKRFRGNRYFSSFKIISVGNLSTGGTGKSVIVPFLALLLGEKNVAIVLRGYKGSVECTGRSVLVTDGNEILVHRTLCGDEAMMHAVKEKIPVVVGKNRARSCELLQDFSLKCNREINYVILDDGYQNHAVKKDLEILLLDARSPFGNEHCLPLGQMREKDYTRADVIILTHADAVSQQVLLEIKNFRLKYFPVSHIFLGRHVFAGIFYHNATKVEIDRLKTRHFLLVAGVGSFQGVYETAKDAGLPVAAVKEFPNHHEYSKADLSEMLALMRYKKCQGILTTEKDWVKLQELVACSLDVDLFPFYIVRVVFEFLSDQEYAEFLKVMKEKGF